MKPRTPDNDSLKAITANFKGGMNTAAIMVKLYRSLMKISPDIPDHDPLVRKGALVYAITSNSFGRIQDDYSAQLNRLSSDIQIYIAQLGSKKETFSMKKSLDDKFDPIKLEITNLFKNRDTLKEQLSRLITDQFAAVTSMQAEIKNGTKTENDLKKILQEFSKKQNELAKATQKLLEDQARLKAKLEEETNRAKIAAINNRATQTPSSDIQP